MIEDDPGDIRLAQEAFKESGHPISLQIFQDGAAAIDFLGDLKSDLPDLIMLDLNLPRKNGCEVLAVIKQNDRLRRIPVVVLSTSSSEVDVGQMYSLRANCFITKPTELDQFLKVIHSIQKFWLSVATLPSHVSDDE
jgi:CheY-like chemotaxis protein